MDSLTKKCPSCGSESIRELSDSVIQCTHCPLIWQVKKETPSYRGIIIKESLLDDSILNSVTILSEKEVQLENGTMWHMVKASIPVESVHEFRGKLQSLIRKDGTWYIHLYHEDPKRTNMIIIFDDAYFNASKNLDHPQTQKAIHHGLSMGIPKDQLDFEPREVASEKW